MTFKIFAVVATQVSKLCGVPFASMQQFITLSLTLSKNLLHLSLLMLDARLNVSYSLINASNTWQVLGTDLVRVQKALNASAVDEVAVEREAAVDRAD